MIEYIISSIAISAVFLYGSVGEIITEKAGHLNLGLPGIMCMGAAGGYFGATLYVSIFGNSNPITILLLLFALIFSAIFSIFAGLIYSFLTVTLRANQNVTGLALTTFGSGFAQYFVNAVKIDGMRKILKAINDPFIISSANKNSLLNLFFSYSILVYLAIIVAIAVSLVLNKTKVGLNLRSIGESPATADAVGINVAKYKHLAVLIGSVIAGIGGFSYICYIGRFDTSASIEMFGWLSVALVIFAMWKPTLSIIGSIIFGFLYLAQTKLILIIPTISTQLAQLTSLLPYIITILVLVITSITGSKENQPPASLGINYFREER